MDYRIFNVRLDVHACDCTRESTNTGRESALKVDSFGVFLPVSLCLSLGFFFFFFKFILVHIRKKPQNFSLRVCTFSFAFSHRHQLIVFHLAESEKRK